MIDEVHAWCLNVFLLCFTVPCLRFHACVFFSFFRVFSFILAIFPFPFSPLPFKIVCLADFEFIIDITHNHLSVYSYQYLLPLLPPPIWHTSLATLRDLLPIDATPPTYHPP